MAGYTKEFLIDAYLHRFKQYDINTDELEAMAFCFYDDVGKDKFRTYASLDAKAIARYKSFLNGTK